ncbi:hypothetical protein BG011_006025 [Mortierella polycephala]|uniref:C2H2-type domain-containing protein n=1 Tax=Mortierella polycephala TaxID=41804 RepID=A0A9P6PVQ0_9FUNG|nr:hypothetical protein BG011_006025 [Mortierella polycephala]
MSSSNNIFLSTNKALTTRAIPVPSEASANLLQSLLLENNIIMHSNSNSNHTTNNTNSNTVSHDFPLFEKDENSFDYPLFADNAKSLQQHPPLHQVTAILSALTSNTNPLCTPQTPSMDMLYENPCPRTASTASSGFDNFSTLLDEPGNSHLAAAVTLLRAHADISGIGGNGGNGGNDGQCFEVPIHSLDDTPFTPYLDTPYETPYPDDFCFESDCASAAGTAEIPQQHNPFSLFPDLHYDISTLGGGAVYSTIEPANLLMGCASIKDQQQQQDISPVHDILIADLSYSDAEYDHNNAGPSSEEPEMDDQELEDYEGIEVDSLESDDDQEDDDQSSSDEDDEDYDDGEFIPSRPLAVSVSGYKRKACEVFATSDRRSDTDSPLPTLSTKRTRPQLASPLGGNTSTNRKKTKRTPRSKKLTAAKRFSCIHSGCARRFARLFNLHTHERTHDPHQVRPFVCSDAGCSKAFSRKHDLQRHEASVHKGERNYKCPTCGKLFSRQDGLRRHHAVKGSTCTTAAEIDTEWSAT